MPIDKPPLIQHRENPHWFKFVNMMINVRRSTHVTATEYSVRYEIWPPLQQNEIPLVKMFSLAEKEI